VDLKHVYVTESPVESSQHQPKNSNQLQEPQQEQEQQGQQQKQSTSAAIATAENLKSSSRRLLYRNYIEKALRTKGLRKMLRYFKQFKFQLNS